MKRILLLILVSVLILTSCGFNHSAQEETLEKFIDAMKDYDVAAMNELLTIFPNNAEYVYLDNIFSDLKYQELYRLLYSDLTYSVHSSKENEITAEVTLPNIQKLYTEAVMMVTNLAITDKELSDKLAESEENGIILIQELMLSWATQEGRVEAMTEQYTLSFIDRDGKKLIVCDDELKALMTGNFFLSKNQKIPD